MMNIKDNVRNDVIYFPAWQLILSAIVRAERSGTPVDVSMITRNTQATYTQVHRVVNDLEKRGIIITKKTGRTRTIQTTRNGQKVGKAILKMLRVLKYAT